jgi:NhaA family Na+:H+ antiporter
MILPLFAFANAGVSLQGVTIEGLTSLLPLGIIAGLFIGKPLGISLFCWLALKLKWASLPEGRPASRLWRSAFCVGLASRCRFLSPVWPSAALTRLINWAKLGILIGSYYRPSPDIILRSA